MSRIMFRFWLDDSKEDENALIGEVGELKANRKFTETIRQGIALITDLRNGSLKVLFELFPFVRAEFMEYMKDTLPDNNNSDIKRDIARLEALIMQQGSKSDTVIMQPMSNAIKPIMGIKPLAPPPQDDDDFELVVSKSEDSGINASMNFLASMQALQR